MHVRQMRIPPPTVIVCVFCSKQAKKYRVVILLCVRMPAFVIKCYVRQMRHCKVCLKGRGGLGGGVSPPQKKNCSKH